MSLWVIRIFFLLLCIATGYAARELHPELIPGGRLAGMAIGFGFGGLLIAIDEMLKGFSLRAFSAATFGLILGTLVAWMLDNSQLFIWVDVTTLWLVRLALFVSFGYIGMVLAMRSNKEDFYLIIPFVRFSAQNKPENLIVLDTSSIIDGRVADIIDINLLEGIMVIPRFVLKELQQIADSKDPVRRVRGRRGLEMLGRLQKNPKIEVKIHESDVPDEREVDAKLVRLAKTLHARLITNDYNLGKIAELQSVPYININELSKVLKPALLPGESFSIRLVREGKDRGQGVGYLSDGTMVVVNQAQHAVGQQVNVQVLSLLPTNAGVIVFADLLNSTASVNGQGSGPIELPETAATRSDKI
jgi:uncharacterized protein YacL